MPTSADTLAGYVVTTVALGDPDAGGVAKYLTLVPGEGPPVAGRLLDLDGRELAAADAYEGDAYVRVAATFGSGRRGWVYVAAG